MLSLLVFFSLFLRAAKPSDLRKVRVVAVVVGGGLVCSGQSSNIFPFESPTHKFLWGGIHQSLSKFFFVAGSHKRFFGFYFINLVSAAGR